MASNQPSEEGSFDKGKIIEKLTDPRLPLRNKCKASQETAMKVSAHYDGQQTYQKKKKFFFI